MRLRLAAVILAATSLSPAFAAQITANSRVDAVTVFPSGAEVTRSAEQRIEAGEHTLIFDNLPGDLGPETIRVEGTSAARIEIGSVDSRLAHVSSADIDARRKALEADQQRLQDERGALDQAIADAEYQKSLMQQLASNAFAPPPKDSETKSFGAADLGQLLDLVGGKLQTLSKLVLDARVRQRELDQQIQDVANHMAQLAPQGQARMTVTVHLVAPTPAVGTFRLKYRVANAGWRPIYDARLVSPEKDQVAKIELVRRADVMQGTTENWDNVALTLSTARPVGATASPDIFPQDLGGFARARAENSALSQDAAKSVAPAAPLLESLADGELKRKEDDQRIDQLQAQVEIAGFQALYAIPGRVSVDNTGTAKKVRISTDALDTKLSARAVPKLDPNAYLTAAFTLNGEIPLLPGVVMLYRDGVFMGQGYLPLLSPGEEARLGFGADDLIKVKRVEVKRQIGEEGIISTSHVDTRAYDVTVKNFHDYVVPVTILDQMPYSSLEEITVETLPGMTPPTTKDFEKKRGVLAWDFDLEPKAEKVLKHGFKITMPADMNVGMNLN